MSTISELQRRNHAFVSDRFGGPLELRPRLRATVIGCLDPRVDPAHVLGLELGDAPVIRNVGGRVTPAVLEALDLLALGFPAELGAPAEQNRGDLVVLHHTQCGITRMQSRPDRLAASFGIAESELPGKAIGDPYASVSVDVEILRHHLGIAAAYRVSGLVYDVATGLVELVASDESVPA